MATPVAIRAAAGYLPDRAVRVAELPELADLPPTARETCLGLGIERIRADDEVTACDLATGAARRALAAAGLAPGDLGALVVVESRVPGTFLSSEATRVQALLGAHRATTFSVGGLGCASLAPALLTARGLLAADPDLNDVLVVHGSKPATPRRYRHPVTVSGDGGQALVLSRRGPVRVLDLMQETNGEFWDLFRVDFRDRPPAEWREECRDLTSYSFALAVETRIRLTELIGRLLARNGMGPGDVSCRVSQNLSVASFRFAEEVLGAPVAPACFDNLRHYGHLGPIDVLLNLYAEIRQGRMPAGGRALLLGLSPVAAWSLLLVETGGPQPDGDALYL